MSLFVEDPAHFSKSRLKSDLVAHNVALPPAKSRKEVYVELYLKHIDHSNAAGFSSDEEDHVQDVADREEDAVIPDPSSLTDDDLKAALLQHGVKVGPIVASTRALYEKKLRNLLQFDGQRLESAVLYSDSEEEEEEEEENGEEQDEESDTEGAKEENVEPPEEAQPSKEEAERDTFKDLCPNTDITPTGIYATRRRPIKGAAGRPVKYAYPDTPASPTTMERREVERRLVPVHIQILVFFIVTCLLYLIYVCVEENSFSPFGALLDSLNQESDSEQRLLPALSGHD